MVRKASGKRKGEDMTKREQIWRWLLTKPEGAYTHEVQSQFEITKGRSIRVMREMMGQGCVTRKQGEPVPHNGVARYVYFANPDCPPPGPGKYDHRKVKRATALRITVRDERKVTRRGIYVPCIDHRLTAVKLATMPVVRLE